MQTKKKKICAITRRLVLNYAMYKYATTLQTLVPHQESETKSKRQQIVSRGTLS